MPGSGRHKVGWEGRDVAVVTFFFLLTVFFMQSVLYFIFIFFKQYVYCFHIECIQTVHYINSSV